MTTRPSRYRSLRDARHALGWSAVLLRFGLFSAGLALFLDQVRPLVSDGQFTWGERRVMGAVALVTLGGYAAAGWVAGKLVRTSADLLDVAVDAAEAAVATNALIETQVVPALVRSAVALERLAEGTGPSDRPDRETEAVRRAIGDGRWSRAEQLVQAFSGDDPRGPALAAELTRARRAEADDLRIRLTAARARDDADAVIDCRDALTRHLRGGPLDDLDRDVVRWLAGRVNARVKAGDLGPETVALAERVADSFAGTAEGAALADALPKLRRRAGLCPACSRPLRGRGDCPDCRASVTNPGSPP